MKTLAALWYALRNLKPIRTFFQTLSAFLAIAAAGDLVGLEQVDWLTALSTSALAAVISFVMAMGDGSTLWTEKKNEVLATGGKHRAGVPTTEDGQ